MRTYGWIAFALLGMSLASAAVRLHGQTGNAATPGADPTPPLPKSHRLVWQSTPPTDGKKHTLTVTFAGPWNPCQGDVNPTKSDVDKTLVASCAPKVQIVGQKGYTAILKVDDGIPITAMVKSHCPCF